ncbi:MAG: hypothetical protein AAFP20_15165 [Cyanobacteria bacterium J06614_10]
MVGKDYWVVASMFCFASSPHRSFSPLFSQSPNPLKLTIQAHHSSAPFKLTIVPPSSSIL